jgi:two-component system, HptB-dependent secretion and biofilm response regulator
MPINRQQSEAYSPVAESTQAQPPWPESEAQTQALTLLLVEDDLISRNMLMLRVQGLFKKVVEAADGAEGLRLFCQHQPDIVLSDQVMPGLSGLDLMREIRATGAKTPVVLMTSLDKDVLLQAINGGIERFIPKPFDFGLLFRTLNSIAREIANERLRQQHREQEVELLRLRDNYHSMQQESAFRKERHVVRHDLRNQALPGAGATRWAIKVAYSPRDIMCGDGYSVRRLYDGRQFILVVDAMGSGMSASLTAMLTTSFFNYQVENVHLWESFTLRIFLKRFQEYLCSVLLDDEVLSCGFFLVDLEQEEVEIALFALPPLLLRSLDGSVQKIRGANPPLAGYPCLIKLEKVSLRGVAELLVMTDGVTDAPLRAGGSYREVLEADFRAASTLKALHRRFRRQTDPGDQDDMTLLHLRRLDFPDNWSWTRKPALTLAGLSAAIRELLAALEGETPLGAVERDEVEVVLTEALLNAFEHGCLGLDQKEKGRLLQAGEYDDALETLAPLPDAVITLSATLWRGTEKPLLLVEVQDSGPGLPDQTLRNHASGTAANGPGLKIIGRFCDSVFTGSPGGHLIILKTLEGDDSYAH